jgi:hypothetical protein
MAIQTALDSISNSSGSPFGFKNRIINGAMVIDQRNAGASVTPTSGAYTVDRFRLSTPGGYTGLTFQQVADAPSGFINSLRCTISTAVTPISTDSYSFLQPIEGLNLYDLGLGTASAKPFVISFWVKSSVTGTFCVAVRSSGGAQTFIADYVVASANTWEYKTVSISAPTSGSFATDNTTALFVNFSLGAGSSFISTANTWLTGSFTQTSGATNIVSTLNATFYITGVQLEKGSTATSFDYRPYGTELALCQRYYFKYDGSLGITAIASGSVYSATTTVRTYMQFPVTMRAAPTLAIAGTLTSSGGSADNAVSAISTQLPGTTNSLIDFTAAAGTVGHGKIIFVSGAAGSYIQGSAEL